MEEKILKKLLHERYSVKQMVGYFIIGFKETENKDKFEEIMNNVTTIIVNIDKNKLVDLVDIEFIEKIDLYWSLNIEQILSYAYIVFKNLMKSNRTIELKDIVSEFLVVAKLYSPDNAVEQVELRTTKIGGQKCIE